LVHDRVAVWSNRPDGGDERGMGNDIACRHAYSIPCVRTPHAPVSCFHGIPEGAIQSTRKTKVGKVTDDRMPLEQPPSFQVLYTRRAIPSVDEIPSVND